MAQRSAIGKAALPPQTEPGTARGLAKQVQVRPSIFAMLWGSCPPFPCSVASFLTQLHPPPTAATPSSTQNAPGFALFGGGPGAVLCFCPFLTRKIFGPVFVHSADMSHRLKPSVMPCRREDLPGVSNQLIAIRHVCVILKK